MRRLVGIYTVCISGRLDINEIFLKGPLNLNKKKTVTDTIMKDIRWLNDDLISEQKKTQVRLTDDRFDSSEKFGITNNTFKVIDEVTLKFSLIFVRKGQA